MEGEVAFTVPNVEQTCKTWYKVFGDLKSTTRRPLVVLHGGPGVVHNYLLALADLATTHSIPVVFYDQLGNGNSTHLPDKNGDTSFWSEQLFITQLESLLKHLGIEDKFDLLGHSWGGMLGARFATTHPAGLTRLVIANSPASMKLWVEAANHLRAQLPPDVQARNRIPSSPHATLLTSSRRLPWTSTKLMGRPTPRSTMTQWTSSTPVTSAASIPCRQTLWRHLGQ